MQKQQAGQVGQTGLTSEEIELVNYVFYKIRSTWGDDKYARLVGDNKGLAEKKRDWAKSIIGAVDMRLRFGESAEEMTFRVKGKVDRIFDDIIMMADTDNKKWAWPDLITVVSFMKNHIDPRGHREFQKKEAIPDLSSYTKTKKANEDHRKFFEELWGKDERSN